MQTRLDLECKTELRADDLTRMCWQRVWQPAVIYRVREVGICGLTTKSPNYNQAMLQDTIGGSRSNAYYGQQFVTPGNAGIPLGGVQPGQPQAGRGRPRAVSNIGMQGNQGQASGISQWQSNVQASQAPPPTSERSAHTSLGRADESHILTPVISC